MNESVEAETEVKKSFRSEESYVQDMEKQIQDPRNHAKLHALSLDDSDDQLGEYCDLKEEVDDLRREVDELKQKVYRLSSMVNWDKVVVIDMEGF